ncbi:hypothetical protein SAV14893_041970 [Streptomyces avermitilis]|uniref:SH3b domain-containing protein n=1 Tax=Streptomyces avermitilis TaxID=33903 RepID=A0A4D4LWF1_STRAX|nr:hypothetical protein SAV14893_041970 [Streptomyces avermitilis]
MATEDIQISGTEEAAEADSSAAATRTYPVAPGHRVNVRSGPGTHYSIVRTLPEGASVPIYCQRSGTRSADRTARRASGTASPTRSTSRTRM